MPWLREIKWDFNFDCCYEGNSMLAKEAGYSYMIYWEFFLARSIEPLEEWAMKNAESLSLDRANYACAELQAKFSGCLVEVVNLRYTEVLIPGVKLKTEEGIVTIPARRPLKIELDQLSLLESMLKEHVSKLADLKQRLKGHRETIKSFKGVTTAEEPDVETYVKMAKAAAKRIESSIDIEKVVIERQEKAIENYKAKIGFV